MDLKDRRDTLLLGFITFSLLLHLLLFLLLPQRDLFPSPVRREPVAVEVRPPQARERELDLPTRQEPDQPRDTPAKQLGPADQVVKREMAPKGDVPEDRRPDAPVPPAAVRRPAQAAPPQAESRPRAESAPKKVPSAPDRSRERPGETGSPPRPATAEPTPTTPLPPDRVPDLQSLLELPQTTVARLDQEWRRKYRPDVEKGDAVWLDTEKDLLISFFQRFRNNIYGVWNYPVRARERGEEGICLLKISINRDGTVRNVQVMEGSGSSLLDEEAVTAVRKGSPYGALPRSYEGEVLNIFAFFEYRLTRRIIY